MKLSNFLIFLSIVLAVYGLANYYIFIRGWQAIPPSSSLRIYYLIAFVLVAVSFIAGRLLERVYLCELTDIMVWVGSFWLGAMLYFVLIIYLLDVVRLINHFFPFYPQFIQANYARTKEIIALSSAGLVALILIGGHLNALNPRVRTLNLDISKSAN